MDHCPMSTLGSRIRQIRGTESQEAFAARVGISKGSIGGYERDENSPSVDVILKICSVTGASVQWLVTGNAAPADAPQAMAEAAKGYQPAAASGSVTPAPAAPPEFCRHCAHLEKRLEDLDEERRELSVENRQLYRDKICLGEQIGDLREKIARLEVAREL